jgi:preprotein translocase subunit SecE
MKLFEYLRETRAEMRHVTWPKTNVALGFTFIIIVVCVVVALILGFFDYVFTQMIQRII